MTPDIPATFRGSPTDEDGEPWLGYIRVSTWKEEKISPELQKTAVEAWAARTGKRIIGWIEDLDATGRNFKRKIVNGIARVERREAIGIACWKYSRFGRTRDGVAVNLKRLEDAGGQLASATEEVDARTATGRLQRGILFEFAAYESDVRGEQWRETHDHRRDKLHLPATGRQRFGYIWHPRRLPDPERPGYWLLQEERYEANQHTGPVMADRYRQFIDGDAFYALVGELNTGGHRTTRGGLWTEQTLIRYMDSGFCAGLLRVHNPKCNTCNPEKRGHCPNTIFIPGAQEELISAEIWQTYLEHRAERRATPPRARRGTYEGSGLMRHGSCRGTLVPNNAQRLVDGQMAKIRGYAYRCGRRATTGPLGCEGVWATRHEVEGEVFKWLKREAASGIDAAPSTPEDLAAPRNQRAAAARDRARLEAEADKLSTALTNLRIDRAANPDDYKPGEYEAARDKIRRKQEATTAAMERLAVVESTPHRSDYEQLIIGTAAEWRTLEARERNGMLRQLARRVVVDRQDGNITVTVHPVWEPDPWEVEQSDVRAG
ncbi:recombinase family protein [Streptomyces noursei]|uniref:Resolvase/invertase-type recombinase catalytic domain-containing protein n=1 Tax=Streptomyces noursei TaxID=1971 RepID=A0A2N8PNY2_STRNR|nr:recombinase family protein [Streptomyces noursei]PNE42729.1 hypothetical protein AOB60_20200 [Streptomyces noursei]